MTMRLQDLKVGDVQQVYQGRPGCGCGCRGRYSEWPATIRRVLAEMVARAAEVRIDNAPGFGHLGPILALEDETRFVWAYLKPGVEVETGEPRTAPVAGAMVL